MAGGVVLTAAEGVAGRFEDLACGDACWSTLFSGDVTETSAMSAGVMALAAGGGWLALHRHAAAEIYFVVSGCGVLSVDGVEREVSAGMAVFIPGDAVHGLRNEGGEELRVFYVFAVDRFSEVVYRFV